MRKFTLATLITASIFSSIFGSCITWRYAKTAIEPSKPCTITWSDGEIHEYK